MSGIFATSVAKILTMPKPLSQDEDAELAAFRARDARWLQLADAALSAAEKTIQALELANSASANNLRATSKNTGGWNGSVRPKRAAEIHNHPTFVLRVSFLIHLRNRIRIAAWLSPCRKSAPQSTYSPTLSRNCAEKLWILQIPP